MPGWFALWTPWTDRKHAALETAIAHAEAATPPEGSTLFAALNEAKEAARRGVVSSMRSARRRRRRREERVRREEQTNVPMGIPVSMVTAEVDFREGTAHVVREQPRKKIQPKKRAAGVKVSVGQAAQQLHRLACRNDALGIAMLLDTSPPQMRDALLRDRGLDGWRPLHSAARHGSLEATALLLEAGADPTHRDDYGRPAGHYARCTVTRGCRRC